MINAYTVLSDWVCLYSRLQKVSAKSFLELQIKKDVQARTVQCQFAGLRGPGGGQALYV